MGGWVGADEVIHSEEKKHKKTAGTIPAGVTSDHLFSFWDVLPTSADIAGLPKDQWQVTFPLLVLA